MAYLISFSYGNDSDSNLLNFLDTMISQTKDNPKYQLEQTAVIAVETALIPYRAAVSAAEQGGTVLIKVREEARKAILIQTNFLAKMIDMNAKGNVLYILEAGFQPRKPKIINKDPFPQPVISRIQRGILSGTIEGEVQHLPKGVKEVCVVHSLDDDTTRQNGTYSSGKKFKMSNLPVKQDVMVWVYFVGTHKRKSDLSDPVSIFVL